MPRGGKREGAGRRKGKGLKSTMAIMELARNAAPIAVEALINVARSGRSESARVSAAAHLLDRGFGKPHQTVEATVKRVDPNTLSDADLAAHLQSNGSAHPVEAPSDPSQLN